MATIIGTPGNDPLPGTTGDDIFKMWQGGDDTATGDAGDDVFKLKDAFTAADSIDGGADDDKLVLNGDYSAGIVFAATTLINVENLSVNGHHDYDLTTDDATVSAGRTFTVRATSLGAGNSLTFDGSGETDGRFKFYDGAGDDHLTGGERRDVFYLKSGGSDHADGGKGEDNFYMGATLTADDRINGGADSNKLVLAGDYSGANALVCEEHTFRHMEQINFLAGHSYDITTADGNVTDFTIFDGSNLGAGDSFTLDTTAETDNVIYVFSGAGDDIVTGGAVGTLCLMYVGGADAFTGGASGDVVAVLGDMELADDHHDGGGADDSIQLQGDYSAGLTVDASMLANFEGMLMGGDFDYDFTFADDVVASGVQFEVEGAGIGTANQLTFDGSGETDGSFLFYSGEHSDDLTGCANGDVFQYWIDTGFFHSAAQRDIIHAFDFTNDVFDLNAVSSHAVDGIDTAVTTGVVNEASVDADIAAAVGAGQLAAYHAVLFTADGVGDLAGHTFLVVDKDGTAGYQLGTGHGDIVFELEGALNMGSISTANFTT